MPKKLPLHPVPEPDASAAGAREAYDTTLGWLDRTQVSQVADYSALSSIDKVLRDAQRAHREGALSGTYDSFRRPIADAYRTVKDGWSEDRAGSVTTAAGQIADSELGALIRDTVLGERAVDHGEPRSASRRAWDVSNQVLTSTVTTSLASYALTASEMADSSTPLGVIFNGAAIPYRLQQERKAVAILDNSFEAYYRHLDHLTLDDLGLLSFCYYDPLFMDLVYPQPVGARHDLATVKAAFLQCTNNYFQSFRTVTQKDGAWLAGLTGAGAAFGIGVAAGAIVAATALTGGLALAVLAAGGAIGFGIAWLTRKLTRAGYRKAHDAISQLVSHRRLTHGTLASSFAMAGDYQNHFFYQCPICHTLFITPLNEDPNDRSIYPHAERDGDTACMVCNAFYTLLFACQREALSKGTKTRWAYQELLRLFSAPRQLRKLTFHELTTNGVPVLLGGTHGAAGGFEPAMFLDTILRYKLCCLFPEAPRYELSPKAVREGHYYRRGQLFQGYSPFSVHFMKAGGGAFDVYELMRRIIQYVTFPLPTELAVQLPFWGGCHMAQSPSDYSAAVRRYWNKDLFEAGLVIAGLREPVDRELPDKRRTQLELQQAIGPLGAEQVRVLDYDEWIAESEIKGRLVGGGRKTITKVDRALQAYLDVARRAEGAMVLREIFTSSTASERFVDMERSYQRRLDLLDEVTAAIAEWVRGHQPPEDNPRFPAVERLLASVRREKARLLSALETMVEPLGARLGLREAVERRADSREPHPSLLAVGPRRTRPSAPAARRPQALDRGQINQALQDGIAWLAPERIHRELDLERFKQASAVRLHPRKGIVKVDEALKAYLDHARRRSTQQLTREIYTASGGEARLEELGREYARRLALLEEITAAIEGWEQSHIPAHTNPRYPAVDALRHVVNEERGGLLFANETILQVLAGDLRATRAERSTVPAPRRHTDVDMITGERREPVVDPLGVAKWCPACNAQCEPSALLCEKCGYIF